MWCDVCKIIFINEQKIESQQKRAHTYSKY